MKGIIRILPVVAFVLFCARPALCLIDVNTASQKELESLPGIGPVKAQRIIEGRPYRSITDIRRVKGIGEKTFDKLKDTITVGGAREAAPPVAAKQQPAEIPVYSLESYKLIECYKCKNMFKVSSELHSGWCAYCGARWRAKDATAPPASHPLTAGTAPVAIPSGSAVRPSNK